MTTAVRGRPEPADRVVPHTSDRVVRAVAVGFLPGVLVFGALVLPSVVAQSRHYPPVWSIAALLTIVLPVVATGVLGFSAPLPLVRSTALIGLAGGLLVTASLPFVVHPGVQSASWIRDIVPIDVMVGVLAVRPALVVVAEVVESVLLGLDRWAMSGGAFPVAAVQDSLYSLLFETVFVGLGVAVLAAARAADVAEAAAQDAAADAAADAARERERARVNALVHDRVLATLLSAANRTPGAERIARADATRALQDLRALLAPEPDRIPVDAEALVWMLQAVTTDLAPDAVFGYEVHPDAPPLSPEVVDTLAAATEEALRNVLRHAAAPNRTVHVEVGRGGVHIEVLDDGVGFDPAQIPPTRLGITESILGRVRALPGGDAFVVSTPGVGTRVQLRVAIGVPAVA